MEFGPKHRTDENVVTLTESVNRMRSIIDSLLLFAQVGHAEIEIDPIKMRDLAEQVKRSLKHEIEAKSATVTVEGDDWPTALGHEPWVEQVSSNYLSNALKYGGMPPKIVLRWSMGSHGDPEFWAQDNGPGLTEAQCDKVFREFERLDGAKSQEGHGLGLSIVRRIVEKLNGKVGLESVPGQGSRFYFTLKAESGLRKGDEASVALPG